LTITVGVVDHAIRLLRGTAGGPLRLWCRALFQLTCNDRREPRGCRDPVFFLWGESFCVRVMNALRGRSILVSLLLHTVNCEMPAWNTMISAR
jgi:hypothetical protein